MNRILLTIIGFAIAIATYGQTTFTSEEYFKMAVKARQEGNLDDARRYIKNVIDSSGDYELRKMAENFFEEIDHFKVSDHKLNISPYGDFKELIVLTEGKWGCESTVDWCEVIEKTDNYIRIWCSENPNPVSRSGQLIISRGDKDLSVDIDQDPGKEKVGNVYFRTHPHNAMLEVVGTGITGYSSSPLPLGIGEYTIRISKIGYAPIDTTVVFKEVVDSTIIFDVELDPEFGKLRPIVVDENGKTIAADVDFRIGKTQVDISDFTNSHSFDDNEPIVYYGFYNEGVIPLKPRNEEYQISVTAHGYRPCNVGVKIQAGLTEDVKVVMRSITGKLSIVDAGNKNSLGATVSIPELNLIASVGDVIDVPAGSYSLFVHKSGYKLDNAHKDVDIFEGQTTEYKVRMTRQVNLYVSTTNGGESVYLNGTRLKYQEPFHNFPVEEGETYKLEVRKEGHWTYADVFTVGKNDQLIDYRNLVLEPVSRVNLRSDEAVKVELYRQGDNSKKNFADQVVLSASKRDTNNVLYIPKGKYKIILKRNNDNLREAHKLAYKGILNVKGDNITKRYHSWMIPRFGSMSVFDIEYSPFYKSAMAVDKIPVPLRFSFIDFPIVRGLSTSIAECSTIYTLGRNDFPEDLPSSHYTVMMPAITAAFMNYDFRIGGGFCQWGDVCALLSYNYYLQYESLFKRTIKGYLSSFDHFEGHELFLGVELCSRIRILNAYVRAGFHYLNGDRCYAYVPVGPECGVYNNRRTFTKVKTDQADFVVTVGFNFGHFGVKRKGHNILRVF